MPVYTRIQVRRDTAANWTSVNPLLGEGEIGLETDTKKWKMGDNTNQWTALGYEGGPVSAFSLTLFDDTTAGGWLTTLGVTSAAQTMLALSDVVGLREVVVPLAHANITALHNTPFTIIAAPASGFAIRPIDVFYNANCNAGAYGNINAAAELSLNYSTGSKAGIEEALESAGRVSDLLGNASENYVVPGRLHEGTVLSDAEARALVLALDNGGSGALNAGNAANTLTVTVQYRLIAV